MCDRLPAEMPSRYGTDSAEHVSRSITSYAAASHVELGDWKQAETEARTALDVDFHDRYRHLATRAIPV